MYGTFDPINVSTRLEETTRRDYGGAGSRGEQLWNIIMVIHKAFPLYAPVRLGPVTNLRGKGGYLGEDQRRPEPSIDPNRRSCECAGRERKQSNAGITWELTHRMAMTHRIDHGVCLFGDNC